MARAKKVEADEHLLRVDILFLTFRTKCNWLFYKTAGANEVYIVPGKDKHVVRFHKGMLSRFIDDYKRDME